MLFYSYSIYISIYIYHFIHVSLFLPTKVLLRYSKDHFAEEYKYTKPLFIRIYSKYALAHASTQTSAVT